MNLSLMNLIRLDSRHEPGNCWRIIRVTPWLEHPVNKGRDHETTPHSARIKQNRTQGPVLQVKRDPFRSPRIKVRRSLHRLDHVFHDLLGVAEDHHGLV
ncbi:hypothetical protein PCS76_22490, partial [Acinetobacter baumannii]|nr:hypothetical protein [Acinetobacter baumannii]